jgi:glutamate carboxypeptidase
MADSPARRALRWLDSRHDEMLALLEPLVLAESPSTDAPSQDLVFSLMAAPLRQLGWKLLRLPGRQTGGALIARPPGRGPHQLLVGHTDTVWPKGTLAHQPYRVDGERIFGPGVFDMKAGLVQLVFALRALAAIGVEPALKPVVFLGSDEEIGSPESTRHLIRLARVCRRALVLEPAHGPHGCAKTARKGVSKYILTLHGRAAHAGLEPERGASAVHALGPLIEAVCALHNPPSGVSVNIGQVWGGTRPNVVAAEAVAIVDVRVPDEAAARDLDLRLRSLTSRVPGVQLTVDAHPLRPPMTRRPDLEPLWRAACDAAASLGLPFDAVTAGGGSDGNTTNRFIPTLDGLGAVGEGAHAPTEHIRADLLIARAALLAGILASDP